jgi:hypothetical protein
VPAAATRARIANTKIAPFWRCLRSDVPQYLWLIGSSSAGNSVITRQPLSVTTTSSSMRAAE